jgi:ubiquinone/menaquinone biosynthesis C-methylase UbiE
MTADIPDKKKIRQVFRNVQKHRLIEQLIRQYSTNKEDIRKKALAQADLSGCENILELGCAFGSFTEALKDKLHPAAIITGLDIVPEYKHFFLEACRRAGYAGTFSSSGVNHIKKYPDKSFDLVICSFALYFFAGMIPEIARVLKHEGIFITITHYQSNMRELIDITRNILKHNELLENNEPLPVEIIVRQFSAENGRDLLAKRFGRAFSIDFKNNLVFKPEEIDFFIEYLYFKSPFFLLGTKTSMRSIFNDLLNELKEIALRDSVISMNKDDRIFICSKPLLTKEQP